MSGAWAGGDSQFTKRIGLLLTKRKNDGFGFWGFKKRAKGEKEVVSDEWSVVGGQF
jgi:hypothetical protein